MTTGSSKGFSDHVDLAGGTVGGAESTLYSSESSNLSVIYSPVISAPVGAWAGGFNHENFNPTDVTLAGGTLKGAGIGASFDVTATATGGLETTLSGGVVGGLSVTISAPSLTDWSTWDVSWNGYVSLDSGVNIGLLGVGVGAVGHLTYDEGLVEVGADVDLGFVGVSGKTTLDPLTDEKDRDHDPKIPQSIQDKADHNPGGLEDQYVNAVATGTTADVAYAASKLPGVYDDHILRLLRTDPYGGYNGTPPPPPATPSPHSPVTPKPFGGPTGIIESLLGGGGGRRGGGGRKDRDDRDPPGGSGGSSTPNGNNLSYDDKYGKADYGSPHVGKTKLSYGKGVKKVDLSKPSKDPNDYDMGEKVSKKTPNPHTKPIIFDLDGDGIKITELSNSSFFVDSTGNGLQNRIAWAAAGDAVLFYDPDNTGAIIEKSQFVFTEWDPTANSDIEAIASVFDTNGDGVLDASDAAFADFKLLVTNADGSTEAKTLAELNITSINLVADATNIELPDGSVITGLTTFTRADGTTGSVGDVTLAGDPNSYRVEQVETTDASGNRVVTSTGYHSDGAVAFVMTATTGPTGDDITNTYDDNGDGVVDRIQTIVTVTQPDGSRTETVTNKIGAIAATAILVNQTVTTTSADGGTITIDRDSVGGGWFDQTETRVTNPDGSQSITLADKSANGTTYRSVTETVSADGLTRDEAVDLNGDGTTDHTLSHVIVINGGGSRSETTTIKNQDGSTRSVVTETVGADGKTKSISHDMDGDGQTDVVEDTAITVNADGSTSSSSIVKNGDGSTKSTGTHTQSDDTLIKTNAVDLDGDGDVDLTTSEVKTINADGSREVLTTQINNDGSVRDMTKVSLGADKVSSETWSDLNQDGVFQSDELVRSVTVDATSSVRTETLYERAPDGDVQKTTTTITSADGLTKDSAFDQDSDGNADILRQDIKVQNADGSSTRTIEVRNQDQSLRSKSVVETSADGLSTAERHDIDGDGVDDQVVQSSRIQNATGSTDVAQSIYAGDGTTLLSQSSTTISADRRGSTEIIDSNGDGHQDQKIVSVVADDGSRTITTTNYNIDGSVVSSDQRTASADALSAGRDIDVDGDGSLDSRTAATTTLLANGDRSTITRVENQDGSLRSSTQSDVSDDGLVATNKADRDGDGTFDAEAVSTKSYDQDGSTKTVGQQFATDGTLLSATSITVSDDGLVATSSSDIDGDGQIDLVATSTTSLIADGATETVSTVEDGQGILREQGSKTISNDQRMIVTKQDVDGDGNWDLTQVETISDDGMAASHTTELSETGELQSASLTEVSANGLTATTKTDGDGDGVYEAEAVRTRSLNSDGSQTVQTTLRAASGLATSWSEKVTSDDGQTVTQTNDLDGDGTNEFTSVTSVSTSFSGVETRSKTKSSADGDEIYSSTQVSSADRLTITESTDVDGDGNIETETAMTTNAAGDHTTVTTRKDDAGSAVGSITTTVSSDGLNHTRSTDRDGDGTSEVVVTGATTLSADGSRHSTTVVSDDNTGATVANGEKTVSGNGYDVSTKLDFDGDGTFDFSTDQTTAFAADGTVTTTSTTLDGSGGTSSSTLRTQSGNGLVSTVEVDLNGDGTGNSHSTSQTFGNGSRTVEFAINDDSSATLFETQTNTSADGRTITTTTDSDGDGNTDRDIVAQIDSSQNFTETYRDLNNAGATTSKITTYSSANGHSARTEFDVNGNGSNEFVRESITQYDDAGNKTTTVNEKFGTTLTHSATISTSANGLRSSAEFDVDGDGTIDVTATSQTVINDDGSRTVDSNTRYEDGSTKTASQVNTSADGRVQTNTLDNDGDGHTDSETTTVVHDDRSTVTTKTTYSYDTGSQEQVGQSVTTASADGLITTIEVDGVTETTEISALDGTSYEWSNGVTSSETEASIATAHTFDASGLETWSLTKTLDGTTTSASATLDSATKARILSDATKVYDTVLDRDLLVDEQEALVEHITNGKLDATGLADSLLESSEFAGRYGNQGDPGFLNQAYLNTYGRAPSMDELNSDIRALENDTVSRAELLVELAQSSEHIVAGNGHLSTNNYDMRLNPAEFERSLDKSYIQTNITNLIDTLFDRAPTLRELTLLTEQMLGGSHTYKTLVSQIYTFDKHAITGGTSLYGLSGSDLVNQAYENALGRAPTAAELTKWTANLNQGWISNDQFIVSLAFSVEKVTAGNSHSGQAALAPNALEELSVPVGDFDLDPTSNGAHKIMDGMGAPNIDLARSGLVGVVGDQLDNKLDASGLDENATLFGGVGNDMLIGGQGDDQLMGGAGADELRGGQGNDKVFFDAVDTVVEGGVGYDFAVATGDVGVTLDLSLNGFEKASGTDADDELFGGMYDSDVSVTISGRGGNDFLKGSSSEDILDGGDGDDHLKGGDGDDYLIGGNGDDNLEGNEDDDILIGNSGNDIIDGDWGDDTLIGGKGADTLVGGGHDDYLDGGDGNDTLDAGTYDDIAIGGAGDDIIHAGGGDDISFGGSGDDVIHTHWGDDRVYGGHGDDTIHVENWGDKWVEGGEGDDKIYVGSDNAAHEILGGKGNDIVYLSGNKSEYTVTYVQNGTKGVNEYRIVKLGAQIIHLQDIEALEFADGNLTGLVHRDIEADHSSSFYLTKPDWANGAQHQGQNDWTPNTGAPIDWWMGAGDDKVVVNGAHSDTVRMQSGNDELAIGAGNDTGYGNSGNDLIYGQDGVDTLYGNSGADGISGGNGNDKIYGGEGSDVLNGDGGNDIITGDSGSDVINGGSGVDNIKGGQGADLIRGGTGDDQLFGEHGRDLIYGDVGHDKMWGGDGADRMWGGANNDTLYGQRGDDILYGQAGDDTLHGGVGNNTLYGGGGNDTYLVQQNHGKTVIREAAGSLDSIDFQGISFESVTVEQHSNPSLSGSLLFSNAQGLDVVVHGETGAHSGIEKFIFDGGRVVNKFIFGSDGNDTINGSSGNDVIDFGTNAPGTGFQRAYGSAGNDTYVVRSNYGATAIRGETAGGADRIFFADLDFYDLSFHRHGSASYPDSLIINGSEGLSLHVHGAVGTNNGIEQFIFADGRVINDFHFGGAGKDNIQAGNGNDFINLMGNNQSGAQIANGGTGSDIYYITQDTGYAGIGYESLNAGNDTVVFADRTIDDLTFSKHSSARPTGIIIQDGSGLNIHVHANWNTPNADHSIEQFVFSDRTVVNEFVFGTSGQDTLSGGASNDLIKGGGGNDTINAGAGADYLFGEDGNDVLDGGDGNDKLEGGSGGDTLYGGSGDMDIAQYLSSDAAVTVNLDSGVATGGHASGDTLTDIEGVTGSGHDDALTGDAEDNVLRGASGNDVLTGNAGQDSFVFEGGDGNDTIADFQQNSDVIRFTGGSIQYSDLNISDSSGGAVVDYGNGDTILVENTLAMDLTEGDFQFG